VAGTVGRNAIVEARGDPIAHRPGFPIRVVEHGDGRVGTVEHRYRAAPALDDPVHIAQRRREKAIGVGANLVRRSIVDPERGKEAQLGDADILGFIDHRDAEVHPLTRALSSSTHQFRLPGDPRRAFLLLCLL